MHIESQLFINTFQKLKVYLNLFNTAVVILHDAWPHPGQPAPPVPVSVLLGQPASSPFSLKTPFPLFPSALPLPHPAPDKMADRKEPPFYDDHSPGPFQYKLPIYETMELFIETLTGTCFELRVSPFEAVLSVKSKIQRLEGTTVTTSGSSLCPSVTDSAVCCGPKWLAVNLQTTLTAVARRDS